MPRGTIFFLEPFPVMDFIFNKIMPAFNPKLLGSTTEADVKMLFFFTARVNVTPNIFFGRDHFPAADSTFVWIVHRVCIILSCVELSRENWWPKLSPRVVSFILAVVGLLPRCWSERLDYQRVWP